jgi:hypothetical protein
MTKPKLIPKVQDNNTRDPHDRFDDLASKIFAVPKSEIDKREKQWRTKQRAKKPA